MTGNPPSETAISSTQLALERTLLAHERTLMAWIRTAASLISFGFTIYKFFEGLREQGRIAASGHLLGSRNFGLIMICIGLVSLALATIQHQRNIKPLEAQFQRKTVSMSLILAALISCLGILGLLAVVFRQ